MVYSRPMQPCTLFLPSSFLSFSFLFTPSPFTPSSPTPSHTSIINIQSTRSHTSPFPNLCSYNFLLTIIPIWPLSTSADSLLCVTAAEFQPETVGKSGNRLASNLQWEMKLFVMWSNLFSSLRPEHQNNRCTLTHW